MSICTLLQVISFDVAEFEFSWRRNPKFPRSSVKLDELKQPVFIVSSIFFKYSKNSCICGDNFFSGINIAVLE